MTTLLDVHHDWLRIANSPAARRQWRTWAATQPALATFAGPVDAIAATRVKTPDPAPVLNAFLALSAEHELAQLGIVHAFLPWMSRHITSHPVPRREQADQLAAVVGAIVEAAITLASTAPHHWPATTIIHATDNPLRRYYRRITNLPDPYGDTNDLDRLQLPIVTTRPTVHARTGEELAIAGLARGVADQSITLEEANLVARVVTGDATAREQAAALYMAPRTAQDRVRRIALRLAEQAA